MTAAVYLVGGNRDHEELRYSLRSLANAPAITQVWILGVVPEWVKGARRVELDPAPEKFANHRQSLEAFCATKGAPREFYLMNEDHYIIEHVEGPLPTFHLGPTSEYFARTWRDRNTWFRAVKNTADWLAERGHGDVNCYEAHTPLLFDRVKLGRMLTEYPRDISLAAGTLYVEARAGDVGVNVGNAKVKVDDDLHAKLDQPMPYLSGNPESFNGAVGDLLRDMFPHKSRWEQ